jgi:hypothetical protein
MRRAACLTCVALAWLFSPVACDDSTSEEASGQSGVPCGMDADCDDANSCTYQFCIDGFCDNPAVAGPDPEAMQIPGDCQEIRCANGVSSIEVDDGDVPGDPDEGDCLVSVCMSGVPAQVPTELGQPCAQGTCDAMGNCSCVVPGGMLDLDQYVDPVNGTDDTMHGGGGGMCAYRTLAFALNRAEGRIHLAIAEYSAATGVTMPILLTGQQRILCDYDDNNGTRASLVGSGMFGMGTATVVYNGDRNGVGDCIVDGGGMTDDCILVASDATIDPGHFVRYSDVSGCANGVHVTAVGDYVELDGSFIHDNSAGGIVFDAGDKVGVLRNHTFANNGTPDLDISCTAPSPDLTSEGNNNGENGAPACQGCMACPF